MPGATKALKLEISGQPTVSVLMTDGEARVALRVVREALKQYRDFRDPHEAALMEKLHVAFGILSDCLFEKKED